MKDLPSVADQQAVAAPSWRDLTTKPYPKPAMRRLRVYAFDPQASSDLDTASINDSVIQLPWETPWEKPVTPGPCGEYLEVIDYDPASGILYEPVDLNAPDLLAQNGLPPSEGRPQFHQQMVYAVAMKTILTFERALGRQIFFAREIPTYDENGRRNKKTYEQLQTLRIYPHALRHNNAYYSPGKTAILFGYFPPDNDSLTGDRWVFTCLSQDIIAHETTHAILHGVHRRSIQATNLDTRAFHEGFADIVALLQHFTMRDVLRQQIKATRGDIRRRSLLNSLAGQFGRALGRKTGALRVALDLVELDAAIAIAETDEEKLALVRRYWEDRDNDPPEYGEKLKKEDWDKLLKRIRISDSRKEAHDRGGYLVAAVFDAFATIYERRTADLMRIGLAASARADASELMPEVVDRLATEAGKTADHVLRMCVRALDYVPPIDMTFGEYLRAIITADHDLVPDDPFGYRIAIAQAFRRRGIIPDDSLSMAPDSLLWEAPDPSELPAGEMDDFATLLPQIEYALDYRGLGRAEEKNFRKWNAKVVVYNQKVAHNWLVSPPHDNDAIWGKLLGIEMLPADDPNRPKDQPLPLSVNLKDDGRPFVQIYSTRIARRAGPDGQELSQLIIQVVQKRRAYFSETKQREVDENGAEHPDDEPDFWFRGGATVLVDLRDGRIRYVIRKSITDKARLERQRNFEKGQRFVPMGFAASNDGWDGAEGQPGIYGVPISVTPQEPFAVAHEGQS